MSKILLIGDCHIGMSYPNNHSKWFETAKEYFSRFLLPLIKKELTKDDIIIQLGDLFDNRSFIPIDALCYAEGLIREMSEICPVHILVGNHDMYHQSSGEVNSISLFKYIHNVSIYDKCKKIEFDGKSILMMPYFEKRSDQISELKKYSGCDYLFCHSDLNGAKMHLTSIAHKNLDKIDVEDFGGYTNVKTGHIHIQQQIGHITFVGSIFEMDRNDMGNQKGIYIIDTEDDTERFIPNNVSPKFKKVHVITEDDIDNLDKVSTKDYIDLFISNSLLISNRKLRRKLEVILETGKFASVDYIDDINTTDEEEDEDVKQQIINESDEPKIQLEYKEIIREYILSQSYENEKIKSGIVSEYNEIVKIYDDEYKP